MGKLCMTMWVAFILTNSRSQHDLPHNFARPPDGKTLISPLECIGPFVLRAHSWGVFSINYIGHIQYFKMVKTILKHMIDTGSAILDGMNSNHGC